jgi:hypothetical protein
MQGVYECFNFEIQKCLTLSILNQFFSNWIFINLNMVFPVVILVFDFNESSEGVLLGY